jgi:hypothetical protein
MPLKVFPIKAENKLALKIPWTTLYLKIDFFAFALLYEKLPNSSFVWSGFLSVLKSENYVTLFSLNLWAILKTYPFTAPYWSI